MTLPDRRQQAAAGASRRDASCERASALPKGPPLLPADAWTPETGAGVLLSTEDEPDARFARAPLIAIEFPVFHDGRGLTLAVLLRSRCGYAGELRAVGDVRPDLVHYLRRCGFDTFDLPPKSAPLRADRANGTSVLAPYSDYYQASVLDPQPAYRRVRRGA